MKSTPIPSPFKILIRSLGISALAWYIIPEDNILIWVILGNEVLKGYRNWQEMKAADKKFEAEIKKFQDQLKTHPMEFD